jgi:hypothetical protein
VGGERLDDAEDRKVPVRNDPYSHRHSDEAGTTWYGGISADDVDHAIADLDPTMTALDSGIAACSAMASTDVGLWKQAYLRWQEIKSDWAYDKQGSVAPGPVYGGAILARVQASNNDATAYQGKLHLACANLAPPPPNPLGGGGGAQPTPPEPPPGGGIGTVGWIVIGLGIAAGVYVVSKTGLPRVFGGKR